MISQIETNIYNERELCFDNFSNLFRQFREISCGDFDGTRIDMFWSNISKSGARVRLSHIYYYAYSLCRF